ILAAVYQRLREQGDVPLKGFAIPPQVVPHAVPRGMLDLDSQLLKAISYVMGDNTHAKRRVYSDAYWAVRPRVRESARQVAASALEKQFQELVKLEQRVRQPGVAQGLHDIAGKVVRRLGGLSVSDEDYENARATLKRHARTSPSESNADW